MYITHEESVPIGISATPESVNGIIPRQIDYTEDGPRVDVPPCSRSVGHGKDS